MGLHRQDGHANTIAVALLKKNGSMSCQQIVTGVKSFSFVKVYKSNITGTGLNGYQFSLQGHETRGVALSGGTTIASPH
jgi:hypothetical protein